MNSNDEKPSNGVSLRERKPTKQEQEPWDGGVEGTANEENAKSKKTFGKTPDGTGE